MGQLSAHLACLLVIIGASFVWAKEDGDALAERFNKNLETLKCIKGWKGHEEEALTKAVKTCKKNKEVENYSCFRACLHTEMEFIKDGKYDEDAIKKWVKKLFDDEEETTKELVKKWNKDLGKCITEFNDDKEKKAVKKFDEDCDAAIGDLIKCVDEVIKCPGKDWLKEMDKIRKANPLGHVVAGLGSLLG